MNIEKLKVDPRMPKHIAFIIDGNGRWAKRRGLPRSAGHEVGARNVEKHVQYTKDLGIKNLSIYAFSAENWNRPQKEVDFLMHELDRWLDIFREKYFNEDVRIIISGDMEDERIPEKTRIKAKAVMEDTKHKTGFILNLCLNYGGRQEIIKAVNEIISSGAKDIDAKTLESHLYTADMLPLDFVVRTSGELRTSNFMPWQTTYSEWYFPKKTWPAFNKADLIKAMKQFMKRNRRFGAIKG